MKRSPIRKISRKRAAQNRVRARLRLEMVGKPCEAQLEGCAYTGTEHHEPGKRSQGADPTDPAQMVWVCRICHDHIHRNVAESVRNGWLLSKKELP